jgi:hypothetical protein
MKISDFYGNPADMAGPTKTAMEVPAEQQAVGGKPVLFWLAMVGLLIAGRIFYEMAEPAR